MSHGLPALAALGLGLLAPAVADAGNLPPPAPPLLSPAEGARTDDPRPPLVIENVVDPDGDAVRYEWDLATDATFATREDGGAEPAQPGDVTVFTLAVDLTEDARRCWRVRATDGVEASGYNAACFRFSAQNDPPTVPEPRNPSDNQGATTTTPVFSWSPSTDPEDEAVTYGIVVRDHLGATIGTVTGVSGTATSIATELENGGTYDWAVRATDRSGASSAFSPEQTFTVNAPANVDDVDCDEVCDTGLFRTAHTTCICEDTGCCQTGGSPGPGPVLAALGLLGLVVRRRRRPRHATSSRTSPR